MPPSAGRPYKGRPVTGPRGVVRSAGVEPATSRLSTWPLFQLEYEHNEPPPGADPVSRRTKARPQPCAAAKLGNQDSNLDERCPSPGPEPGVLPVTPFPIANCRRSSQLS